MKIRYLLWLFLVSACYAQIVSSSGGDCIATGGANCPAPPSGTSNIHVGDTIIAIMQSGNVASNPVPTGCGLTWPTGSRYVTGTTPATIWIIPHATVAATNCNVIVTGLSAANAFLWQAYSNVQTVGTLQMDNTPTTGGGTSLHSQTLTSTGVGSVVVGMFFGVGPGVTPFTVVPPSVNRRWVGGYSGQSVSGILGDQTATASGQSINVSYTSNAALNSYRRAVIELVPAPNIVNRTAHPNDAMQTVLMNAGRDMNYELPAGNALSPTWCSWFMPTGSHVYDLVPETTTVQINGQTGHIKAPRFQMTRICRDQTGNYWTSPPLLAGTGITLSPAATGITISSSGGGGGMTYVAGGTTNFLGALALASHVCEVRSSHAEPGVLATDVISWSLQNTATLTGWASITVEAVAAANQVNFQLCNPSAASVTPAARNINWYILRHTAGALAAHHKVVPPKKPARPIK